MKRSKHSLSHYRLTTFNMGELYPVLCEEVLPGDSFRHSSSVLLRVSPLVAPVMHPVHIQLHHWYVPLRILWDNFEDFITGSNTDLLVPVLSLDETDTAAFALAQSLGVGAEAPPGDIEVNVLPFRAYNLIWNEFYRDQDLNTPLNVRKGDSGDLPSDYAIQRPSWEKDYFTTARPYPQQGEDTEVVALQLQGLIPVKGIGKINTSYPNTAANVYETGETGTTNYPNSTSSNIDQSVAAGQFRIAQDPNNPTHPGIFADLGGGR